MTFWTHFLILCNIMLNIEPKIEKDSFTFVQDNTIIEMGKTNSYRFNTHV